MFCLEYKSKLAEYESAVEVTDKAFEQIKSTKVLRTLEYILAVGNYINNPNRKAQGFKFSSLMKLVDVKAKAQSGVTLLHTIAQLIDEKEPELLLFVDEMDALKDAESAINVAQTAILFMKKSAGDLEREVKSLEAPEDNKMKDFFEATLLDCKKVTAAFDIKVTSYSETVTFFGEQSSNDIAGFFQNWSKFVSSFRAAVKFNIAMAKKQEIEDRKAQEEREKKKEEENVKKFADTLRASRKKGAPLSMLEQGKAMDEAAQEEESDAAGGTAKARARRTRARKAKPTQSLVEDIISDNGEFLEGPSASMRDDNGVVKQISRGLRSGDTFTRLRGKRAAKVDPSAPVVAEPPVDTATRRQLRSQKSTFSRRDGSRAAKKEVKEEEPKGGRMALTSINWG